jgi:hypothetical protein
MLQCGVQLSFGAGKTAAMIAFHGKGATNARHHMENTHGDSLIVLTEHQGAAKVPLVAHYKHLGGYVTRSGSCLQEIRMQQPLWPN